MCFHGDEDAKLLLGSTDDNLYYDQLQYVPLLPPYAAYLVNLVDVTVGGESIMDDQQGGGRNLRGGYGIGMVVDGGKDGSGGGGGRKPRRAMVDTGATALRMPDVDFLRLQVSD